MLKPMTGITAHASARMGILAAVVAIATGPAARATEWHVPADFPTIQAAIDASADGDIVTIADGVWTGPGNKCLYFDGKAITVRSANGPANCIVDCEDDGLGFGFGDKEGPDSILQGVTITNGRITTGGAIYCGNYASPTVSDCVLAGNVASMWGGGIHCGEHSSPTFIDCTVRANKAYNGEYAHLGWGGGAFLDYDCRASFINCVFSANAAIGKYGYGGAVYGKACDPVFTNCTFTANTADCWTGGLLFYGECEPTLTNCIIWGNEGHWQSDQLYVQYGPPLVTYCDVQGGWTGDGNIDADPHFAFPGDCRLLSTSPCIDAGTNTPTGGLPPADADGNPRPLDGDGDLAAVADIGAFEFNPDAPSIALTPAAISFLAPLDGPGPEDQVLSIRNGGGGLLNWDLAESADWLTVNPPSGTSSGEISASVLHVDVTGLPLGTYSTMLKVSDPQAVNGPRSVAVKLVVHDTLHVPSEYPTIQAAIDATNPGDVVEVADGIYAGDGNTNLAFTDRGITLRSASGDPALCIIDCAGSGGGFGFVHGLWQDSRVEGFTVTNAGTHGAYCGYNSSPTIVRCVFENAVTGDSGAGVECICNSHPVLIDCAITGNTAYYDAGFHCYHNCRPILIGCAIDGNQADVYTAGFGCHEFSDPTLVNCLITGNSSAGYAGGVSAHCRATLANCTISGNSGASTGGIYASNFTTAVTNCILWQNSPTQIKGTKVVATYCDVDGGWEGQGNIDADPLFVDPAAGDYRLSPGSPCIDAANNDAVPADSLDLDDDGDAEEPIPFDFAGKPRFADDPNTDDTGYGSSPVVDMGAHEYQGPSDPADVTGDGVVDISDLLAVLGAWGPCPGCPEDITGDGVVDVLDLLEVLLAWGAGA